MMLDEPGATDHPVPVDRDQDVDRLARIADRTDEIRVEEDITQDLVTASGPQHGRRTLELVETLGCREKRLEIALLGETAEIAGGPGRRCKTDLRRKGHGEHHQNFSDAPARSASSLDCRRVWQLAFAKHDSPLKSQVPSRTPIRGMSWLRRISSLTQVKFRAEGAVLEISA